MENFEIPRLFKYIYVQKRGTWLIRTAPYHCLIYFLFAGRGYQATRTRGFLAQSSADIILDLLVCLCTRNRGNYGDGNIYLMLRWSHFLYKSTQLLFEMQRRCGSIMYEINCIFMLKLNLFGRNVYIYLYKVIKSAYYWSVIYYRTLLWNLMWNT